MIMLGLMTFIMSLSKGLMAMAQYDGILSIDEIRTRAIDQNTQNITIYSLPEDGQVSDIRTGIRFSHDGYNIEAKSHKTVQAVYLAIDPLNIYEVQRYEPDTITLKRLHAMPHEPIHFLMDKNYTGGYIVTLECEFMPGDIPKVTYYVRVYDGKIAIGKHLTDKEIQAMVGSLISGSFPVLPVKPYQELVELLRVKDPSQ